MFALWLTTWLAVAAPDGQAVAIDEAPLVDAVERLLHNSDVVRLAIVPTSPTSSDVVDADMQRVVERALVRIVRDRKREEVVGPALLRARARAIADATKLPDEVSALAADHALTLSYAQESSQRVVQLRLIKVESGVVLGVASAEIKTVDGDGSDRAASSVPTSTTRRACQQLADQLAEAVEAAGISVRGHAVAVPLFAAQGSAANERVDQLVQLELMGALQELGFVVLERTAVASVFDQVALGQMGAVEADQAVAQAGRLIGAQSVVVGQVVPDGTSYLANVRLVDTGSGVVRGAARAAMHRDDVVTRADVELRTPLEAGVRSLVAPGWGQAYNGDDDKALLFAASGYGGVLFTGALAAASFLSYRDYVDSPPDATSPFASNVRDRRSRTDALIVGTTLAAVITAVVWGASALEAATAPAHTAGL